MQDKKLVVVGDCNTGKTSLLLSILHWPNIEQNDIRSDHVPTVFDNYATSISLGNGVEVNFNLWDTSGDENYDRLRIMSYENTDIVIICFSFDSAQSLKSVANKWIPEIEQHCPGVPFFVVANKTDVEVDQDVKLLLWETGETVATSNNAKGFFQCSALTKVGVKKIFVKAAKEVLKKERKHTNFSQKCKVI